MHIKIIIGFCTPMSNSGEVKKPNDMEREIKQKENDNTNATNVFKSEHSKLICVAEAINMLTSIINIKIIMKFEIQFINMPYIIPINILKIAQ